MVGILSLFVCGTTLHHVIRYLSVRFLAMPVLLPWTIPCHLCLHFVNIQVFSVRQPTSSQARYLNSFCL